MHHLPPPNRAIRVDGIMFVLLTPATGRRLYMVLGTSTLVVVLPSFCQAKPGSVQGEDLGRKVFAVNQSMRTRQYSRAIKGDAISRGTTKQ